MPSASVLQSFINLFKGSDSFFPGGAIPPKMLEHLQGPPAWEGTRKPHSKTSRLARFPKDAAIISPSPAQPIYTIISQARCETTSEGVCLPIRMSMSSGHSCLAVPAMGGYKNRSPVLYYHLLQDNDTTLKTQAIEVGLGSIAYHSTTDEQRKLIFIADDSRIKSYGWQKGLPTHTMSSHKYDGPLAILSGDRIIRAGCGGIGLWNLDSLPTHGKKGTKTIGQTIRDPDSWRDDPENIETSTGTPPEQTIAFEDLKWHPAYWTPHPSSAGVMITACDPQTSTKYSCYALDLENGGKTASKYLGHGGGIHGFSTDPLADPNVFTTACSDGYARLYDVREALPVMTFDTGNKSCEDFCSSVVLVHPDGVPMIFAGTEKCEAIKTYDIRMRSIIYELSTGNNAVTALAWDASRNVLYAGTECNYVDRLGYHHDYRKIQHPKSTRESGHEMDSDEEENEEDSFDEDEGRYWPQKAHHDEHYFGYMFDAGGHRIFRYAFKAEPDVQCLPPYSYVTLGEGYS